MPWIDHVQFDKSRKAIQSFGLILAGIVFAYGVYSVLRHHTEIHGIATLSILIILSALFFQWPLKLIYYPWMVIVRIIGFIIIHILLAIVFYFVLTPIGLVKRIVKKVPSTNSDSFWIKKDHPSNMERMF